MTFPYVLYTTHENERFRADMQRQKVTWPCNFRSDFEKILLKVNSKKITNMSTNLSLETGKLKDGQFLGQLHIGWFIKIQIQPPS